MCLYPVTTLSGPDELEVFFPGLSGAKPTNTEEVPFLYYIEIAHPLAHNISGISFYFSPELRQMEYFTLVTTDDRISDHDSSTCKCPPECCFESVSARGYATECRTESVDCPPSAFTAMKISNFPVNTKKTGSKKPVNKNEIKNKATFKSPKEKTLPPVNNNGATKKKLEK
jgi:hypothetical protein